VLSGKRVLLIIGGGIAAYKCLEVIRRLRDGGASVRCILTDAAQQFVTPLSVSALSGDKVYTDLFSLTDESEMGHIRLTREADLVVVAPATADIIARMAAGLGGDLAGTALLANDKPVLIAPAMNVRMWDHPATSRNMARLRDDGVAVVGPEVGPLADGEYGTGRLAEPQAIVDAIKTVLAQLRLVPGGDGATGPLAGKRALVTSGPTHEAIDPVRYLANRSSGKQGHAIAAALAAAGADTVLVSGPTAQADPPGVRVVAIVSARAMLAACLKALPVDIAVCAAAVADWRVAEVADAKIKKSGEAPTLTLVENPDILARLAAPGPDRAALVIGFAAETEKLAENASAKRARKGCDWILANDVSPSSGTFGGDHNTVTLVASQGAEDWPKLTKAEVAARLTERIAAHFEAATGARSTGSAS
jgi:phosphopantothenoylcysteine decarboxylase/phosphopantothenate--cysteine ligase